MVIKSEEELRKLYGFPSGRARAKVLHILDNHASNFIAHSPFFVLSTTNKSGKMDASPRGGEPGFVKKLSDKQLIITDFKGNNRIDSLSNIVETGVVGMLFMIPGIDETLRINGKAIVSTSQDLLEKVDVSDKSPRSCIVIDVEEVFLHCAKAFIRSKLWSDDHKIDPNDFPTMGQMLKDQLKSPDEPESREDMLKRYQKDL